MEDDPAWHSAETKDEDVGETSNYSVGQKCLDRLSISLGGNTIVPVGSEQLPAYLVAPEWQKRHVALIALAQIAEGCLKVMIKNLEQVVAMVLTSFPDQHPRVRWADINAIEQLSTDLGPDLQVKYHQGVLPALAGAMDDFQNPRVQSNHMLRAASMECISLVGMAVGKEKFMANANQVMEVLMSLQVSQMETDDPTTIGYGLDSANPDVTITSVDSDNDIEDSDDERIPSSGMSLIEDEDYSR
ncbi:hypothetical protein JHK82_052978 [Glycine max]|nr:hypothetical protein JHK86_052822 [Glycine max]KAG4927194.1 hypothetical protein JHK85_053680 [Glycine max]KAG5082813.1 hypothetical protein JHK84_052851 [Glycine max]KAG5085581.1 hypothetical protein JHK82_052978 [Glycine max]